MGGGVACGMMGGIGWLFTLGKCFVGNYVVLMCMP